MFHNTKAPKTYILVHGAWHGSWCWHKVAAHLQRFGHKALTPDLPGHGCHQQDFTHITLTSYVQHIEALVHASERPLVLIGHSMGGVVITQVAENVATKIDRLIYVSAFVPQNKGSLIDEERKASHPSVALEIRVEEKDKTISLKPSNRIRELFYGNCNNEDAEFALARLQTQPLLPFLDVVSISKDQFGKVPKLYIECLQDKAIRIEDQRRMHSYIECDVVTLDADHSPFFSADLKLAQILNVCTEGFSAKNVL